MKDGKMETDKCEWCGMEYPKGGYTYWSLKVYIPFKYAKLKRFKNFSTIEHKICDDCKNHLKEVKND